MTGNNTLSGPVAVTGGTLILGANAKLGNGTVTVGTGTAVRVNGSLANVFVLDGGRLGGNGTIGTDLGLNSLTDILSPGNSPGILSLQATQNWSAYTYEWEANDFDTPTAGLTFDQIQITGALSLTGGPGSYALNLLSFDALNTAGNIPDFSEIGQQWTILTTTAGIDGFNAAHWTINTSAFTTSPTRTGSFSLTSDGSNLYLNYNAIPEPGTYALLVGGLAVLAGLRRRANKSRA